MLIILKRNIVDSFRGCSWLPAAARDRIGSARLGLFVRGRGARRLSGRLIGSWCCSCCWSSGSARVLVIPGDSSPLTVVTASCLLLGSLRVRLGGSASSGLPSGPQRDAVAAVRRAASTSVAGHVTSVA